MALCLFTDASPFVFSGVYGAARLRCAWALPENALDLAYGNQPYGASEQLLPLSSFNSESSVGRCTNPTLPSLKHILIQQYYDNVKS